MSYVLAAEPSKKELSNWDGQYIFSHFQTIFPEPERAIALVTSAWNGGHIFLAQADYGPNMVASVCQSTLPDNRTPGEDMDSLRSALQQVVEQSGKTSNGYELAMLMEGVTQFGPTLIQEITNMAPGGKNGPFPLNIGARYPIEDGFKSMSMSAIFQVPEMLIRMELSIWQKLPNDFVKAPGQDVAGELRERLGGMLFQFLENTGWKK